VTGTVPEVTRCKIVLPILAINLVPSILETVELAFRGWLLKVTGTTAKWIVHYMHPVAKPVPYAIAGFPSQEFWLPRNTMLPPVSLQRELFSFIEELFLASPYWKKQIDSITLDLPEDTGRMIVQ